MWELVKLIVLTPTPVGAALDGAHSHRRSVTCPHDFS